MKNVFVNRILNMKKISYIGLDMDHTLVRYKTKKFESKVYELVIQKLIKNLNYPIVIKKLKFYFHDAIRGLVIDCKNGNILKLSLYGAIRLSYHGTKVIQFAEQNKFYRSVYVDLNDPNYLAIDTSFSIALCVLYSQLVDLKDENPETLPSYTIIAHDILKAVDEVHAEGELKQTIKKFPEKYVIQDPQVVWGIKRYLEHGKKFFILTNSTYQYCNHILQYSINPFLKPGETWQDLFEYVITLAGKPRFFYETSRFLQINAKNATMTNLSGILKPGIYQGGSAAQFTFDLAIKGDEILYIGDHIYGDILRLKKDCNWRTALVIEELGTEIKAQYNARDIEKQIAKFMQTKRKLEEEHIILHTRSIEEDTNLYKPEMDKIQKKLIRLDQKISTLIGEQLTFYNSKWERVFRAGADESYFAYQVERYACIYMEKLSDLLSHSPLSYFRSERRFLPHDLDTTR